VLLHPARALWAVLLTSVPIQKFLSALSVDFESAAAEAVD